MNNSPTKTIAIFAALAALMAATRFNHFGSAVSLPDASYAVFFLGGLYLTRSASMSVAAFIALILEAGWIDYYATSVQGVADWCMSPAYWFLIPTYASLWLVGRWVASRNAVKGHTLEGESFDWLGRGRMGGQQFLHSCFRTPLFMYSLGVMQIWARWISHRVLPNIMFHMFRWHCCISLVQWPCTWQSTSLADKGRIHTD